MKIQKLSEKNLKDVLEHLFPRNHIAKKSIIYESRRMIVDWYFETADHKFAIEFDGPTHFCNVATQKRDLKLKEYCDLNGIKLVRFPYFIQISDPVIRALFSDKIALHYDLYGKVECEYLCGFWDQGVLPGNYNSFGWKLFFDMYSAFTDTDAWGPMQEIYESAHKHPKDIFLGLDPTQSHLDFWKYYPT